MEIVITQSGSFSPLGLVKDSSASAYREEGHLFSFKNDIFAGHIPFSNQEIVAGLSGQNRKYNPLDRTTLLALKASEFLDFQDPNTPILIGTSRGNTEKIEQQHRQFLQTEQTDVLCSPLTTAGNIASWVAQHLGLMGVAVDHSMTCSSSFYALLHGIAWLKAGLAPSIIIGGAEAALTPFTLAQMRALGIYTHRFSAQYPCLSGDFHKTENTMTLGEGACLMKLEVFENQPFIAKIKGFGFASEKLTHHTFLSKNAENLRRAMLGALGEIRPDAVVMHCAGTRLGDLAEHQAINSLLGEIPITNNKWKIGHSFGASALLSLEMALYMLENQLFINTPFNPTIPEKLDHILVNAMGFGGNAVSILIGRH